MEIIGVKFGGCGIILNNTKEKRIISGEKKLVFLTYKISDYL